MDFERAAEVADMVAKVKEILQWVGAPIWRQIQYLCCFSRNITSLRDEANQLEVTARDLQAKVDGLRNDLQVIHNDVETWLQNSNGIKNEIQGILNEASNVESSYLKLRSRFFLSRKAKKTTDRVKELIILGQSKLHADVISNPRTAAATREIPSRMTYDFDSRKKIEEEIMTTLREGVMTTLREGDVNMMAIYGMGGLGKTTMAIRIMNRALKEHVFEEIVMVVVSQHVDKLKIQLEIGGTLGLKRLQDETSQARLDKLYARLKNTKKTLLVLDDVWEELVPEDLGIPSGCRECTILLTSRNHDVLRRMHVQKIFGMEVLSAEDSWIMFRWIMFRDRVGTCVDNPDLNSIAKEVVNECKGLPLAITTVGAALTGPTDVVLWKNSLCDLRRSNPAIPEFIKGVYNPLKLSYDFLGSNHKYVFLLCCLYPEDAHIPLERLTYFCMGLRLLEGAIGNVEEERDRIRALSKVLKSRSLLLDSEEGDDYVRMHDVVRDVCIFIAKQKGYIGDNDMTSSLQRYKLDSGFELLQIRNSDEEITFDGITNLYVLSIESCRRLRSLPFTQRPNNLITLVLDSCWRLETLSVVGELVNLEILICHNCYSVKELPPEVKGLNRLKVLDLSCCENLQRIGRGIISSLVGLEELKMLQSFDKWEAEDREERKNAGLRELEALTNLRCLEIDIEDLALAAENIRLSSEVDRFTIRFLYESEQFSMFGGYLSNKNMCLYWWGATSLGDWIKLQLLRDTECLLLVGNGANEALRLTNLENIRHLELGECVSMTKVDERGATVFPSIEHLDLFKLPKLEEICDDRISSNSFQNLKILKLHDLPVLKQLWKSSQNDSGKDFLPQLEVLKIRNCEMMEAVFLWEGNENNSCHPITKRFPKLKKLGLEDLPNLISLCQGIEGIEFPQLKRIRIEECKKMKGMTANGVTNNENNSGGTHHIFCESRVSFGCLKKLNTDRNPFCSHTIQESIFNGLEELAISTCAGSRSLFTSSMVGNLVNLKELRIMRCDEMVEVIKDDEEEGMSGDRQRALLFPKLHTLKLECLPKLVSFCESTGIDERNQFPVLRSMEIRACRKMKGMVANSGGSNASDTIHLFCESQQVSFLKKLDTDRNSFSELEELKISWCQSILSLFTSSMVGNLVNLKELKITYCHEMVEVIKDDEENGMSGGQRTLLFPKLQKLELWHLPKLVSFCESKGIESIQFPVLRSMEITELVRFCESKGIESIQFPVLRIMKIKECGKMKGMVANGVTSNENNSGGSSSNAADIIHLFCQSKPVSFGCLKELDSDRNPFCSHVSIFNSLEELAISTCAGSRSLFTSSMVGNLVNLKELKIRSCDEMVEVIKDDEEEGMSGDRQRAHLFPKLQKLELSNLPKLVSFCESKGIESIQFPILRSMDITRCGKMKGMVADGVTSNENNSGGSSTNAADIIHLFCQSKQVSFSELEELQIFGCQSILSLFTSSMAGNLVNLKELHIYDCDEMVEVIKDDEEKGMSGGCQTTLLFPKLEIIMLTNLPKLVSFCESKGIESILFPKLQKLILRDLPKLVSFCESKGIESIQFPVLRRMVISRCRKMKGMVANGVTSNENNSGGSSSNASDIIHLFCQSKQVSFGCLKELESDRNPFCSHTIDHVSLFNGLERLTITKCAGSQSLFTFSIARKLVNLKELKIEDCFEMVEVIKDDEEKGMSGDRQRALLFPKLQKIELSDLPSLVRFCEWKCDVELPSLTEVVIKRCHNMKSFTLGHLNTPKLESVKINWEDVGGVKDLNELVQQWYLCQEEERQRIKRRKQN